MAQTAARVSLVVQTIARAALAFTDIRCRSCNHVVMRVPGRITADVHIRAHGYVPQHGRTVRCRSCRAYVEIIER